MMIASRKSVRVQSKPKAFGSTKQSFEIKNDSKKEVTVFLERLGSEYFRIPERYEKFTLKPGTTIRIQVEFHAPKKGFIFSLNATYKAAISVWVLRQDKGVEKELIDMFSVKATCPGFVSLDSLHCFHATGSVAKQETGRRAI